MPAKRKIDPRSVAGKDLHVDERVQVLVVGGGPAGLAAAIEAVGRGLSVMLVDENPVPFAAMGEDVPLHFGGAAGGAARNRNAMLEAYVASDPQIERAFEAGVNVRLGTAAYGLWGNGPSVGWLPGLLAGLVDDERSWLAGCERAIVAAGRRDMGLAFPGWDVPGVLGATAAMRLAERYDALEASRVVVLGTSAEALQAALSLNAKGVEIAAIIEQAASPVGPRDLIAAVREAGIEILAGHVVREAVGRGRVEGVLVAPVSADGRVARDAAEQRLLCDGVVIGVGTTPVVELLDGLGCRLAFQPERGGYAPHLSRFGMTSVPSVYAVGDAAGIWPAKTLDPGIAVEEGRIAADHAAASLEAGGTPLASLTAPDEPAFDLAAYRLGWVRASVIEARGEPHVCLCEEVTAREILEVRPPRYLDSKGDRRNDRSLRSLLGEGPPHPDQVKRLTRAGMGPCQGRRCREQVAALLALGGGVVLAEVPLAGYRAPVRPLPLGLAGDMAEPAFMREQWDTWFGIPAQYRLAKELPPLYTVAAGSPAGPVASE